MEQNCISVFDSSTAPVVVLLLHLTALVAEDRYLPWQDFSESAVLSAGGIMLR